MSSPRFYVQRVAPNGPYDYYACWDSEGQRYAGPRRLDKEEAQKDADRLNYMEPPKLVNPKPRANPINRMYTKGWDAQANMAIDLRERDGSHTLSVKQGNDHVWWSDVKAPTLRQIARDFLKYADEMEGVEA